MNGFGNTVVCTALDDIDMLGVLKEAAGNNEHINPVWVRTLILESKV